MHEVESVMHDNLNLVHKRISVVADRRTATLFRLAGLKHVYSVDNDEEVDKYIRRIMEDSNILMILITDRLINRSIRLLEEITENKYPLIIPVPGIKSSETTQIDLINDLVRRKAGIEFKLQET